MWGGGTQRPHRVGPEVALILTDESDWRHLEDLLTCLVAPVPNRNS